MKTINAGQSFLTQQFLLQYLLNNSDTFLRTKILLICSSYMPLPLVCYQPINQKKEPTLPNNQSKMMFFPYVYEELFYCFEKYMAVLAFKVSANPNKSPQGCTSLTNYIFNRQFELNSNSKVNYGTIEIQFDYNFESPFHIPVADAHGLVDDAILELVYPIFNIFMIHALVGADHEKIVQKQIEKINKKSKNSLVFVITHNESSTDQNFEYNQIDKIVYIKISRFNDLQERVRKEIRSIIIEKHFMNHIKDFKVYDAKIQDRLSSLYEFSQFAKAFRDYRTKLMKAHKVQRYQQQEIKVIKEHQMITDLMKMIIKEKDNLRSYQVLGMNIFFDEACRIEKKMLKDTSLTVDVCDILRSYADDLYIKMADDLDLSPITQKLRDIIRSSNYLGVSSIISKLIKSFLISEIEPLYEQRKILNQQNKNPKLSQNQKKAIQEKIREIAEQIEQKRFSNEFLYREIYIKEFSQQKGKNRILHETFPDYLSLAKLKISQGSPFEIIDGNNLQFIKEVYQKLCDDAVQMDQILVLSVIGPFSSGKSLILNTLFGTEYISGSGRCTRGVYGSLIDIKTGIKKSNFKKILILDSEGTECKEATDDTFDKRIIFYMLSVSHIVLICNKGEMKNDMERTIKLAADSIMKVREMIDQQPEVHIIMNDVDLKGDKGLAATIQGLEDSLQEMNEHEKLRQVFTIDQEYVSLLPHAFEYKLHEEFSCYKPSQKFTQQVENLREKIQNFIQCCSGDAPSYTLESWFNHAQKIWEFTDGYVSLTDYNTVEEKQKDIDLFEFIKSLIQQYFHEPQMIKKNIQMINDEVNKIFNYHQGFDQTSINEINKSIFEVLKPKIKDYQTKIMDDFQKYIQEKGMRKEIKERREEQLATQIKQHFFNWHQHVQKQLEAFNQDRSKFICYLALQKAIDRCIQGIKKEYTVEEAEIIFNKEWDMIEKEMIRQSKSSKEISDEAFKEISQLYRAYSCTIINIESDLNIFSEYSKKGNLMILKNLKDNTKFFFYNSKSIKPRISKLIEQILTKKHFLQQNIHEILFDEIPKVSIDPKKNKLKFINVKNDIKNQDKFFAQYLEDLIYSDKILIASATQQVQAATYNFFNYIDHFKIVSSIQNIVLNKIFRLQKYSKHGQSIEDLVQELIKCDDPSISENFCTLDFKIIQMIADGVEGLVSKINEDMEPFNLIVSECGIQYLHQIAQTYIIRIMQQVIRLTQEAPLLTLKKTKDIQRRLFIAKLTSNDQNMDLELAKRAAKNLADKVFKNVKDIKVQAFQEKINGQHNHFKLKNIVQRIENRLILIADGKLPNIFENNNMQPTTNYEQADLEISKDEMIMFYVQPDELLKLKFNTLWNKIIESEIKIAKEEFADEIKKIHRNFQEYFRKFLQQIESKNIQLATNIFIPVDQKQQLEPQKFKNQCQKALATYIGLVVTKMWQSGSNKISGGNNAQMIVPNTMSLITFDDIGIQIPIDYAKSLQQSIQNETISNLKYFIGCLIEQLAIILDNQNSKSLDENEIICNLKQAIQSNTLGCNQRCPLCNRQCDQDHEGVAVALRIHRCDSGHQILGFGGKKDKQSNVAIQYGCYELRSKEMIEWQAIKMNWHQFQLYAYNELRWDLQTKNQDIDQLREKQQKIWNLIGPYLCNSYKEIHNNNIIFNKSQTVLSLNTFYILMLDKSGSMTCEDKNGQSRWGNIIQGVQEFIATLIRSPIKYNKSKISIITHNHESKLKVEYQTPKLDCLENLKRAHGGNDFDLPLIKAREQMDKYNDKFEQVRLIMMSDGEWTYPSKGVQLILNFHAKQKLVFKSIAYGPDIGYSTGGTMEQMAKELRGEYRAFTDPNDLLF